MKDLSRHMKYVQKKVIQTVKKEETITKEPLRPKRAGKMGQEIKNRRSGRRRRI